MELHIEAASRLRQLNYNEKVTVGRETLLVFLMHLPLTESVYDKDTRN